MEHPNYYAIIPANVRYDEDLKSNAKLLYGEITALSNKEGYCWSTNDYFAKLYDVDKLTVSRWISQLVEKGYIISKLIYDKKTKQVLERRLYIAGLNVGGIDKKIKRGIDKKIKRGIDKKIKDNNTSVNTTSNNIYIGKTKISKNNDDTNAPTKTKWTTKKARSNFSNQQERKKPPTLNEIESFIAEHNIQIDASKFYNNYSIADWTDSKGKKVINWQQKINIWEANSFEKAKPAEPVNIKRPESKVFVAPKEVSISDAPDPNKVKLQFGCYRMNKCSMAEANKLTIAELKAKFTKAELLTLKLV